MDRSTLETQADQATTDHPEAFEQALAQLLEKQKALAAHLVAIAEDPVLESQTVEARQGLEAQRNAALLHWARLGLTWALRGGRIELSQDEERPPEAESTEETEELTHKEEPAPEPVPTARVIPVEGWRVEPRPMPRPVVVDLDPETLIPVLIQIKRPPAVLLHEDAVSQELAQLSETVEVGALDKWRTFPKDVQKALVGLVVARARYIQDDLADDLQHAIDLPQLDALFSNMTAFSKREQPGFVFGLQRSHHPVGETWAVDARTWWDELVAELPEPDAVSSEHALEELRNRVLGDRTAKEIVEQALKVLETELPHDEPALVRLMTPHLDKLRKHTRFKRLRKAIREALAADEAFEEEITSEAPIIPKDWAYLHVVRGRRTAIVGGAFPAEARNRIMEAFQFGAVTWSNAEDEDMEELLRIVRAGHVDMVIVLRRFAGNRIEESLAPICRERAVPLIEVSGSYGIIDMRFAIEETLGN